MVVKKKQHYVPKFYLNYFVDTESPENYQPYLWIFEKGKKAPFKRSPTNVAFENYFYSFDPDDHYPNEIEDRLAEIEADVKFVFNDLINSDLSFKDFEKKYLWCKFLSFMNNRTVKSREHFRILASNIVKSKLFKEINSNGGINKFLKKHGKSFSPEEFVDFVNSTKIIPPKEIFLELMIQSSKQMIPLIALRNWLFLVPKSGNRYFITSDFPMFLFDPKVDYRVFVPGILDKETDIIFPITPKLCFYASNKVDNGLIEIEDDQVTGLNRTILGNCNKYIFSNTNDYNILFN